MSVGRLRRGDAPAKACKCALGEGCGFVCGGRLKRDHRLATATVQRRYPRCAACRRCEVEVEIEVSNTRPLFAAIAIATVMSVQGGQRAQGRAVTVQLCKLCWQEGAARCRTCTHWEDSQGRLSSPLLTTLSALQDPGARSQIAPADSRRALLTCCRWSTAIASAAAL